VAGPAPHVASAFETGSGIAVSGIRVSKSRKIVLSTTLAGSVPTPMFTVFTYERMVTVSTLKTAGDEEPRRYHHGDLRAALIEAGLKLIEERAADDLGLREVARAVGVSATAVYRHFADRGALMAALGEAGFAQLGAAQLAAANAAGGGLAAFNATGRAYVRFALERPGLFRLIFASRRNPDPGRWSEKSTDAMNLLRENAVRLVAPTHGEEKARLFALRAWALVHGLAMLVLDGQVAANQATIDAVIDAHDVSFVPQQHQ
jgi:AcrR family transcriptional regulator